MTSWSEAQATYRKTLDDLNTLTGGFDSTYQNLKTNIGKYVDPPAGQTAAQKSTLYAAIIADIQKINNAKQGYITLKEQIITTLTDAEKLNLPAALRENGELQKHIQQLRKVNNGMKVDAETAMARDELLRSRDTNLNAHQLFLLDRPVRRGMVPYLWALSIIFITVGLVILKGLAPNLQFDYFTVSQMIGSFFTNTAVLMSLLIAALITIIFLSLQIAGVFSK
jgi:hypothetical protein